MPPKYQPKRQAPKRLPKAGAGKPPRSPESGLEQPAPTASRFDENGFLIKSAPATKGPDGFDFPAGTDVSPKADGAPSPARPKTTDFNLEPQEFSFGPSSEDRFTRGRKLGGAKGEDFWADPALSGKGSKPERPNRKDPFFSDAPGPEISPLRRTPPIPRTEAIRPDHIDPSPKADLPGDHNSNIEVLDRQGPRRVGLQPKQRRSDAASELGAAAVTRAARPAPAEDAQSPYKQVRKDRHSKPEAAPEPTEVLSTTTEPKLSRRERKQLEDIEKQQQQSLGQWFKEITLLGVVAIGTAILLTTYLVQAFFIPSISMENTLLVNDRVLVNKAAYKFSEPKYNDIIVFISPDGNLAPPPPDTPYGRFMDKLAIGIGLKSSEQDLIKRVIATSGQTIEVRVGVVFVDGKQLAEAYRKDDNPMQDFPATKVPEGHVFVLGDNRSNSGDSRSFGPVDESKIIGKAFARIWPMDRIQFLK